MLIPMRMNAITGIVVGLVVVAGTALAYWGYSGSFAPAPGGVATTTSATTTSTGTTTGTGGGGIAPYGSGVRGFVMLGPTCPVERMPPDPACTDKPYQTLVAVFRTSDPVHAYAIGESGADGSFSFNNLPPGEYEIGAGEPGPAGLPRCAHVAVTVPVAGYATTTVPCDTGIR